MFIVSLIHVFAFYITGNFVPETQTHQHVSLLPWSYLASQIRILNYRKVCGLQNESVEHAIMRDIYWARWITSKCGKVPRCYQTRPGPDVEEIKISEQKFTGKKGRKKIGIKRLWSVKAIKRRCSNLLTSSVHWTKARTTNETDKRGFAERREKRSSDLWFSWHVYNTRVRSFPMDNGWSAINKPVIIDPQSVRCMGTTCTGRNIYWRWAFQGK